jgi:hypothetical protein
MDEMIFAKSKIMFTFALLKNTKNDKRRFLESD